MLQQQGNIVDFADYLYRCYYHHKYINYVLWKENYSFQWHIQCKSPVTIIRPKYNLDIGKYQDMKIVLLDRHYTWIDWILK